MTNNPITALMPTNPIIHPAWFGCLRFAVGDAELMAQFRAESGCTWTPGCTAIDHLIDKATGADMDFLLTFVRWFNRWVWGEIDGRACNGDEEAWRLWGYQEVTA